MSVWRPSSAGNIARVMRWCCCWPPCRLQNNWPYLLVANTYCLELPGCWILRLNWCLYMVVSWNHGVPHVDASLKIRAAARAKKCPGYRVPGLPCASAFLAPEMDFWFTFLKDMVSSFNSSYVQPKFEEINMFKQFLHLAIYGLAFRVSWYFSTLPFCDTWQCATWPETCWPSKNCILHSPWSAMVRNPQDSHHQRVSRFLATLWHEKTFFQVGWLFEFLKFIWLCGVSDVFSMVSVGLNFKGTQARNIVLKPAAGGCKWTLTILWPKNDTRILYDGYLFPIAPKRKGSQRLPLQISSKNIKSKCLEIGKTPDVG